MVNAFVNTLTVSRRKRTNDCLSGGGSVFIKTVGPGQYGYMTTNGNLDVTIHKLLEWKYQREGVDRRGGLGLERDRERPITCKLLIRTRTFFYRIRLGTKSTGFFNLTLY